MTTVDFRPTHVVPQDGLPAWDAPDVNRPTAPLDALLPVQLADRLGDWGRIVCANGWSAWVDGRLLIAVPSGPPAAGHPLTRTADPGPLLAKTEEALSRYRRATEELAAGGTDGESFRSRTHGLRVGMVVDGESMWLYDAEHERWVYCDGTRLSTYATGEPPSAHGAGDGVPPPDGGPSGGGGVVSGDGMSPEPTQVVGAAGPGLASAPSGEEGPRGVSPVSGGGMGAGGAVGPEAARAAGSGREHMPSGEEGPRGVSPVSGGGMGAGGAVGPEAARAAGSGREHMPSGEEVPRRVPPVSGGGVAPGGAVGPQPTQVVEAGPGAGAGAGAGAGPGFVPDPCAEEPTRRIPPVTVDPGAADRRGEG